MSERKPSAGLPASGGSTRTVKVDAAKVKAGDLMALTYWVKIKSAPSYTLGGGSGPGEWDVEGVDSGVGKFFVKGKDLIEAAHSADYFATEKKVSQTECAELLISSHNRPFTVVFEKANGEVRTLRGRLLKHEALLGRSHVEDLDITTGTRLRLVDHRTLSSLTVDGVRYVVK